MSKFGLMIMFMLALSLGGMPAHAEILTGRATVTGPGEIRLNGRSIRLHDIRMPGDGTQCVGWRGQRQVPFNCHEHATAALTSMVAGEEVSCVVENDIGTCYTRGQDIAYRLVSEGWASTCGQTNRYVPLEEGARNGRQGMWTGNFTLDTQCPALE